MAPRAAAVPGSGMEKHPAGFNKELRFVDEERSYVLSMRKRCHMTERWLHQVLVRHRVVLYQSDSRF